MLRNKREEKDREIRAAVREMDALQRITWNAPIVKLETPYQNGWLMYHVLRDDYTRRNDAEVFRTILKQIGGISFCRKPSFEGRNGKTYKPSFSIIGENEWKVLGWPEYYKKYFSFGLHRVIYNNDGFEYGGGHRLGYKFNRTYCFATAIKPHIVTHIRTVVPEAQTRLAELRNHFDTHNLWKRYWKIKGCGVHYSADYELARKRFMETLGTKEIEQYDKYGDT